MGNKISKREAYYCPKCGEGDVNITDMDYTENTLTAEMLCCQCKVKWKEHYTLMYSYCEYKNRLYNDEGEEII